MKHVPPATGVMLADRRRPITALGWVAWLALLAAALAIVSPARAAEPSNDEMMQLHDAAQSPARMPEALALARKILANDPPKSYFAVLRQLILQSLIRGKGPTKEIVGATDTIDVIFDDRSRMLVLSQVANVLMDRGEELPHALRFARAAYFAAPAADAGRPMAMATYGRALLENGNADSAQLVLEGVGAAPDSGYVLLHIGRTYEKRGERARAIESYVRAIGVFPAYDSTSLPALKALYKKEHGNLKGLDERIVAAQKSSKSRIALDGRRWLRDVPEWEAPDYDGKMVGKADYAGKVVLIDFWGTWCGPCRQELPILQRVYDQYKDRVAFITINWERHASPEAAKQRAWEYMRVNALKFPVAFDYDYAVAKKFEVQAFPTMLLVDRTGRVQYRNVGVDPAIEKVMIAQLDALLEEPAE